MKKLLLVLALALAGCTLAPSGVYNGNKTLYTVDATITSAYTVFDQFVKWEYNNRTALAVKPDIRKVADQIRQNGQQWFATAEALRDTYASNPTTTNEQQLTAALALIQTALTQASQYLQTTVITGTTVTTVPAPVTTP